MEDRIEALSGFIAVRFRTGFRQLISVNDIRQIKSRREKGTLLRLVDDSVVLLSCELDEVAAAVMAAKGEGLDETA